MQMHNSPHSGSILKEDVLPELGLTVTQADYELWQAEHSGREINVEPAHAVPA